MVSWDVFFLAVLTLDDALALLADDGVDEVIVQSGQPVRTVKGFTETGVPGPAPTPSSIVGMLQSAQLQRIVPRQDTAGEEHVESVEGCSYRFRIARFLDLIELRISIAEDEDDAAAGDKASSTDSTVVVTAPTGATPSATPEQVPAPPRRSAPSAAGGPPAQQPATERPNRPDAQPSSAPAPVAEESPIPGLEMMPTFEPMGASSGTTEAPAAPEPVPLPVPDAMPERAPTPAPAPVPPTPHAPPVATQPVAAAVAAPRTPAPAPPRAPAPAVATSATARLSDAASARLSPTLAQLIAEARRLNASDVHLTSDQPVRIRVGGRLAPQGSPLNDNTLDDAVGTLLSAERRRQLDERGYVDLGVDDPHAGRLRINVCRHRAGVKICARLVAAGPSAPTDLGLPWEVEALSNHHQGLVVCSGPSGAGKTTTLAALVQLFNERKAVHIITVEDPVEIQYPRGKAVISQREVGTHTLSFRAALKGALREDPDIIAIGELRDRETVEMALSAAETGHLVIATMSTPSGAQTIERLIDMFPPDDQSQVRASLAGALKLVVSQRLLQCTDGKSMVAAFEMITGNVPLWSLIRDRKLHQLPSLLQRGRAYGMVRLEDSLRRLLVARTISRDAAVACAQDPKLLGGEGLP